MLIMSIANCSSFSEQISHTNSENHISGFQIEEKKCFMLCNSVQIYNC